MKLGSFLFACTLLLPFTPSPDKSASWSIDSAHSSISFKVRHLGISNVRGEFTSYDAQISMEGTDLSTLSVNTTIESASIDTGNERRDNHLRSDDFFGADEFPEISFVSTGVTNIDENNFHLEGNLTMKDVTLPVVLEGAFLGTMTMGGSERAGFEASTSVNRMDYNLSWDRLTETGGIVVGHEVQINLDLELIKD